MQNLNDVLRGGRIALGKCRSGTCDFFLQFLGRLPHTPIRTVRRIDDIGRSCRTTAIRVIFRRWNECILVVRCSVSTHLSLNFMGTSLPTNQPHSQYHFVVVLHPYIICKDTDSICACILVHCKSIFLNFNDKKSSRPKSVNFRFGRVRYELSKKSNNAVTLLGLLCPWSFWCCMMRLCRKWKHHGLCMLWELRDDQKQKRLANDYIFFATTACVCGNRLIRYTLIWQNTSEFVAINSGAN